MSTSEIVLDAIHELAKSDLEEALMVVTGAFVGLNVAFVEINGSEGDGNRELTIDGPEGQRKITIHAA